MQKNLKTLFQDYRDAVELGGAANKETAKKATTFNPWNFFKLSPVGILTWLMLAFGIGFAICNYFGG